MAGLYVRELLLRADARRVLIVAPGGLVEQWRDELFEKFGLEFPIYSPLLEQASPSGNPFEDQRQLIVRLDQMARNEDLQAKLCSAGWDLVVFDEAHKLAAHFSGSKVETTARFRFAEKLGRETRHLLLMTATPHNGKEEDFQLFLSLLDSDRFYGKFRDGVHKVDVTDIMREAERYEITHVPAAIRERDRRLTGRNRREQEPVLKRYERIAFIREAVQPVNRNQTPGANAPGSPRAVLMLAVIDMILETNANLLRRGAVLVDPADDSDRPWLMVLLTHAAEGLA